MGMLVCHQAFIAKRSIAPAYDLQYRFSADFDWYSMHENGKNHRQFPIACGKLFHKTFAV
jgi:hypothetical protein